MNPRKLPLVVCAFAFASASPSRASEPSLTIYNQNFGVVREHIALDLQAGRNEVRFTEVTAHLEPDSVVLRDLSGGGLRVLEQNFRGDPVSQGLLLSIYEGRTVDFVVRYGDEDRILPGKIIRSSYMPHQLASQFGNQYWHRQMQYAYGPENQPLVEIDGKLRFGLPGTPLFPELADDTILKPTLQWVLETDMPGRVDAELAYVTGGMRWEADYNVIAPNTGVKLELVGWVTIDNQSGRTFENAGLKLVAGDVRKLQPSDSGVVLSRAREISYTYANQQQFEERGFDEYHLYELARKTTVYDRETKQVEFIHANGITSKTIYVYHGSNFDWPAFRKRHYGGAITESSYRSDSNPKVWVMREFKNSADNGLGMPLPKGRIRFYRRDTDGAIEFSGEDVIDHTPKDETVRIYTGNAFDIVGERRRTDYNYDAGENFLDESFEIKLRNHKAIPVEVRVVEWLARWSRWELTAKSHDHTKLDSHKIEFPVTVEPNGESTVTYTVHYSW